MASPPVESPLVQLTPPELPAAWSADVVAPILARARDLVAGAAAEGPVLELWRPESRRLLRDAAFLATGLARTGEPGESATPAVVPQPASFATIVSLAGLVHLADLPLAVRGLGYLLRPGGRVHLVEPIGAPGVASFAAASLTAGLAAWLPAVRGLHLHRDVPAALRAEGFTLATIERFSMPGALPSLRSWMCATAVRIEPSGPPSPSMSDATGDDR
jgi:hypothetical protein